MKTEQNLAEAFAGECQTHQKYLAFGDAAAKEGFSQVAKLFMALAAAEAVHAQAHLRAKGAVKSTARNLAEAIASEQAAFETRYPDFLGVAEAEGHRMATQSMRYAMAAEAVHHRLLADALRAVDGGQDLPTARVHVCGTCGYTVIGGPPALCPECAAGGGGFAEILP